MASKKKQHVMSFETSQILPIVRDKNGWLIDSCGMPVLTDDPRIEIVKENDMDDTNDKTDAIKGLITAYEKLNVELKKEMAMPVKNTKKITLCNKRINDLKKSLLGHSEYIKNHLHKNISTIVK